MPDALAKVAIPETPAARARAFAVAAVLLTVLGVAGVVAANVAVDPRDEFGSPLGLQPVVQPDPAQSKLDLYRALAVPPSAVVVGSSRAIALPPQELGPAAFNFAIVGAGVADALLVYDFLVRDDPALERVVLNVDVFGVTVDRQSRLAPSSAYDDLTGSPRPDPARWRLIPGTVDALYVRDSLRALQYTATEYPRPLVSTEPDGLQRVPTADEAIAAGRFDLAGAIAKQYTAETIPSFAGERRPLDQDALADLRAAMADASARGLAMDVFLPPYQPDVLEVLSGRPVFVQRLADLQSALVEGCLPGIRVFDYTDGSAIGLDPGGYYDGHHVDPANGARILAAMETGAGNLCGGSGA